MFATITLFDVKRHRLAAYHNNLTSTTVNQITTTIMCTSCTICVGYDSSKAAQRRRWNHETANQWRRGTSPYGTVAVAALPCVPPRKELYGYLRCTVTETSSSWLWWCRLHRHTRQCPDYFSNSVQSCSSDPARIRLRSAPTTLFHVQERNLARAFSAAGPVVWNSSSSWSRYTVSSFNQKLNTHFSLGLGL